jgi:hypothetical protein
MLGQTTTPLRKKRLEIFTLWKSFLFSKAPGAWRIARLGVI